MEIQGRIRKGARLPDQIQALLGLLEPHQQPRERVVAFPDGRLEPEGAVDFFFGAGVGPPTVAARDRPEHPNGVGSQRPDPAQLPAQQRRPPYPPRELPNLHSQPANLFSVPRAQECQHQARGATLQPGVAEHVRVAREPVQVARRALTLQGADACERRPLGDRSTGRLLDGPGGE